MTTTDVKIHPDTDTRYQRLRRFNAIMATLHALQGAVLLAISSSFSLPVTASFLRFDPATQTLRGEESVLFRLQIGPAVAAFLFISAIAHAILASPAGYRWYRRTLARGIQPARWIEYAFSSSLMIVLIAMLVGIYDIVALLAIAGVNAAMILFGWMMELHNEGTERTRWISFWFGSLMGALPWIGIAIYLFGSGGGADGPPTFVYFIFLSLFLFFNTFAVNMALQYKRVGRWRDYLYGERAYIVLSLVAKSLLAWQVYAGTLQPPS